MPCPRDEALEAAVWSALDALPTCAALSDRPGEADIVLDFTGGAPELRARDTFADDVVRLDGAQVISCVAPALSVVRQTMGATRLVVSFRVALRSL